MSGRDKKFTPKQEIKELKQDIHQGLHDYNTEKEENYFASLPAAEKRFKEFSKKHGEICNLFEPLALNASIFGRLYIITPKSKTEISNSIFNLDDLNGNGRILEELATQGMIQLINLKDNVYMVAPFEERERNYKRTDLKIKGIDLLLKGEQEDKNLQNPEYKK